MERFETVIEAKNVTVRNYPEKNDFIDIVPSKVTVLWSTDIELRGWGIKTIGISIEKVSGWIFLTPTDDAIDEVEFTSEGWEINSELKVTENGVVCPASIDIDYETRTITVS